MSEHYHFIGIGGIGMSAVAQLFMRRGITVSGSDLREGRNTQELKRLGARIFIGHNAQQISGANLVVYSSAVKEDNPEIVAAKKSGVTLLRRAEALAMLMQDKIVITVCGAHGKTTTSSLAAYLLLEAGLLPSMAIGGILRNIDSNASLGDGDFFVAEADESDGSFLYYRPKYSIITNIDYEHLDYYNDFQTIINTFKEFIARTREDGCIIGCYDDANLRKILKESKARQILFGLDEESQICAKNIIISGLSSDFDCFHKDKFIGRFHLALGGRHNISNALAVIALGLELAIDTGIIRKALAGYRGTGRRLEIKFHNPDYMVFDDYAHHPTEIRATLSALKNLNLKRMIAIFQPHRFTRTKFLLEEFSKSFDLADSVIITDIYSAGEQPLEGISGRSIFDKIRGSFPDKQAIFLPKEEIVRHILEIKQPGDLIVTLGAGDIIKTCDELVERLKG